MKYLRFENKKDYELYLKNLLQSLKKDDAYNIYAHCITSYSNYGYGKKNKPTTFNQDCHKKLTSIKRKGLDLGGSQYSSIGYGSINGTMNLLGSTDCSDEDMNKLVQSIVNYDYFSKTDDVNSVIIAIPKKIKVGDTSYEFSTIDGSPTHFKGDSQFVKNSLYDLIKTQFLPHEFCLGYQSVGKTKSRCIFTPETGFLESIHPNSKKEFLNNISKSVDKLFKQYNTRDTKELVSIVNAIYQARVDDFYNEP